jgi:hypothetical protein
MYSAVKECTALTRLTIPAAVVGVCSGSLDGCTALTEITFGGTKSMWQEIGYDSLPAYTKIICQDGTL